MPLIRPFAALRPATGRAAITITIAQGAGRPAIVGTQWGDDGPEAALHAHERARTLRAGDTVTVKCDGMRYRYSHRDLVLDLIGARDIELTITREERSA